ncbi:MAG: hypothetical protein H6678_07415 [Candidatus Delongbacteria bacterium]|nr:hypothetical protein [Candidatus Delongbacteria bacterium]
MKLLQSLCLAVCLAGTAAQAKLPVLQPLPDLLTMDMPAVNADSLAREFPDAPMVILDWRRRIVSSSSLGMMQNLNQMVELGVVLDPSRSEVLEYTFTSLPTDFRLRVKSPGEEIREYGPDQLQQVDESVSVESRGANAVADALAAIHPVSILVSGLNQIADKDLGTWRITVPGAVRGTLVECTFGSSRTADYCAWDPASKFGYYGFSMKRGLPVLGGKVEYILPRKKDTVQRFHPQWLESSCRELDKDFECHTWITGFEPAIVQEHDSPSGEENRQAVYPVDGRSGPSVWGSRTNMVDIYLRKNMTRKQTRKVGKYLKRIPFESTTREDSLRTIVKWVQQEVKTVETANVQHKLSQMLSMHKALSFQKVAIAVHLCRAAGYQADLSVLSDCPPAMYAPGSYRPSSERLFALLVRCEGESFVALPQISTAGLSAIPSDMAGKVAWNFGTPDTLTMGCEAADDALFERRIDVDLRLDGRLDIVETHVLHGLAAWSLRESIKTLVPKERIKTIWVSRDAHDAERNEDLAGVEEQIQDLLRDMVRFDVSRIRDFTGYVDGREDWYEPLELRMEYTVDGMVEILPDEALFTVKGLFAPDRKSVVYLDTNDRKLPLHVDEDQWNKLDVTIRYPVSWQPDMEPFADFTLENDFGRLSAQYTNVPGRFELHQEQRLNHISRPATEYGEFLKVKLRGSDLKVPAMTFLID